jgi:hypothetical protein
MDQNKHLPFIIFVFWVVVKFYFPLAIFNINFHDCTSIPKINHHRNGKGLLNYDYIFVTWQMGKVFKQD